MAPDGQLDPAPLDQERAHGLEDATVGVPVDPRGQRVASTSVATAWSASGSPTPRSPSGCSSAAKTAAHHVSNVLAKLGVRNRAGAIAYATRQADRG
jgi:hypothetical protein